MHDAHAFLQNLALVFCVAAVTTVVFHRLRQPVVFGYLLAGMLVGPYLPVPAVADPSAVRALSELGVILLMFSLGLEFSMRRVLRMAGTSGLAALGETSVMVALGFLAAHALGWTPVESVFTGGMVAISSTTIVARAFAEQDVRGRVRDVVFGILIVEDLIAILLVAVLTALAAGGGLSPGGVAITGLRLATFLVALISVGAVAIPRFMRAVVRAGSAEMTLVASIGICFGAALVAVAFGYSVALGAFVAGSLVSESGEGAVIERVVEPVRDLFLAIFFVSVGMLIDPRVLVEHWGAVLALVLLVVAGKMVAVTVGAFFAGNGLRPSLAAGMSLAQIGEFSFIIAAVGTTAGVIRPELYPVMIAVSAITALTTPWLIRAAEPVAAMVDRGLPRSVQTFVALYGSWVERIRSTPSADAGRVQIRRLVRLLVLDALLLALVIIGFAEETGRFAVALGQLLAWPDRLARIATIGGGVALSIPLVVGLVRVSWRLGFVLAVRALPAAGEGRLDYARVPRNALVITLRMGVLFAVLAPLAAVTQPFLRGTPTMLALVVAAVVLAIAFLRAARDLQGHTRAGAEVIVLALEQQMRRTGATEDLSRTMEHVSAVLPGLGEPTAIVLRPGSPAVGRTLAELNLRALTGAMVLAIVRPTGEEHEIVAPTGHERLRLFDTVAVAGSQPALAAAREILGGDGTQLPPVRSPAAGGSAPASGAPVTPRPPHASDSTTEPTRT